MAMRTIVHRPRLIAILSLLASTVVGCGSADERFVDLSKRSLERQAEQNKQMAQQSQEVAQAARQLVTADAQARNELIAAQADFQRHVQTAQQGLDRQHESLESERKELAAQRQREPILAAAICQAAMLLACLLPLVVCCLVLKALRHQADAELGELLLREFADPEPLLLERTRPAGLAALPGDRVS
jgi:hypothetical protein